MLREKNQKHWAFPGKPQRWEGPFGPIQFFRSSKTKSFSGNFWKQIELWKHSNENNADVLRKSYELLHLVHDTDENG